MEKIDIYDLMRFYLSKWMVVLVVLLFSATLGYLYASFLQKPLYVSESRVLFINKPKEYINEKDIVPSLIDVLSTDKILRTAVDKSGISRDAYGVESLRKNINIGNSKGSDMITIKVKLSNPQDSQKINNSIRELLIDFFNDKYKDYGDIQTIDSANLPINAVNVNVTKQAIIFTGLGFVLIVAVLFVVYDRKVPSRKAMNNEKQ